VLHPFDVFAIKWFLTIGRTLIISQPKAERPRGHTACNAYPA